MKFLAKNGFTIALVLLVTAVFCAYANVYSHAFLYDDEFLIQKNANLREWSGLYRSFLTSSTGGAGGVDSFYRPMQGALYTIVYQVFGETPAGFQLLNVGIHAANAALVAMLALRLGFSPWAAVFASLLWALHPLHTEAVTYKSATADPLHALFVLAALLLVANAWRTSRLALAGVCYLLGLLSKESAIVFPAMLCAVIFFMNEKRWSWRAYVRTFPFWAVAALYLVARKTILDFDDSFRFYKMNNIYTDHILYRLYTFFATLPSYLRLLLWPSDLHMDRGFPVYASFWFPPVVTGALLVAGSAAAVASTYFLKPARPVAAFALLWFFAAHAPHTGVLLPVNSLFLEHWLYLPSIGFFLALGHALASAPRFRAAVVTAVGMASLALGVLTFRQNEIWATPITFYSRILQYEPKVGRVHNNLAMAYSDLGQDDLAIRHYRIAIDLGDTYAEPHHNLALALLRRGDTEEAVKHLKRALEINPHFAHSARLLESLRPGR